MYWGLHFLAPDKEGRPDCLLLQRQQRLPPGILQEAIQAFLRLEGDQVNLIRQFPFRRNKGFPLRPQAVQHLPAIGFHQWNGRFLKFEKGRLLPFFNVDQLGDIDQAFVLFDKDRQILDIAGIDNAVCSRQYSVRSLQYAVHSPQ